jgi:RluA family pseudouridine synthase
VDINIIFEDESIIIVDKPPGVVVNRAESVKTSTMQDQIEDLPYWNNWKEKSKQISQETKINTIKLLPHDHNQTEYIPTKEEQFLEFIQRSGIVHRLDKETSGCLVIAKTPSSFVEMQRQFKERIIKKTYMAIAHGEIVPKEGVIEAPVGRQPWNRMRFGIVPGGKPSLTRYAVQNIIVSIHQNKEKLSVVVLKPESGRTHQIRVHLKYINHPIVGDELYAGRKVARDDRTWVPRVMLHAWKIELFHPDTKKPLAIEAPIPEDMNTVIQNSN